MSSTARKLQRNAAKIAKTDAKKLFREALGVAERVEAGIRNVVNTMPLHRRIGVALKIVRGVWR
jgi:hypothetical protein